jgi:hypothetical protein
MAKSQPSTRSRQSGRSRNQPPGGPRSGSRGLSRGSTPGFYTSEAISQLPNLPWSKAGQSDVVAHVDTFAVRLFRGESGHLDEERSRPAGTLLTYILTRFQGSHLPLALEKMSYYMAETPVTPGIIQVFQQTASTASDGGNTQVWLTSLVRAIEYGTLSYVFQRIQGVSAKALTRQLAAIKRDLQTATTVLKATDSTRRLAICLICQIALQVTQSQYDNVPERLQECIKLLGKEFGMQDVAQQLASGIIDSADIEARATA